MNMKEHEKIALLIRYYEYCRQNFHARAEQQEEICVMEGNHGGAL